VRRGPGRRFLKGRAKTGGKKKGTLNKRTIVQNVLLGKEETLEKLARGFDGLKSRDVRIKDLLRCRDRKVVALMERTLMEYDWGKPEQPISIGGPQLTELLGAALKKADDGEGSSS
jgi:hypothetical protein